MYVAKRALRQARRGAELERFLSSFIRAAGTVGEDEEDRRRLSGAKGGGKGGDKGGDKA